MTDPDLSGCAFSRLRNGDLKLYRGWVMGCRRSCCEAQGTGGFGASPAAPRTFGGEFRFAF